MINYGQNLFSFLLWSIITLNRFNQINGNEYEKSSLKSYEICSGIHAKRMYLEYGDGGSLRASNVSVRNLLNYNNKLSPFESIEDSQNLHQYQCYLEIVSCPSCIINITISFMNLSSNCKSKLTTTDKNQTNCQCNQLQLSEPPYDAQLYGKQICGTIKNNQSTASINYVSKTRTILIKYLYKIGHMANAFSLDYIAERNSITITGEPTKNITGKQKKTNVFTSPFFPSLYPRDIATEYVIKCIPEIESCRIRLIFTDFQISVVSTMEFYDWNDERINVFSGNIFRPPLIISQGPMLTVKFYANSGTGLGFRAEIVFLTEQQLNSTDKQILMPITNCGGFVETLGGAITMMNMIPNDTNNANELQLQLYDCYWLIRPPTSYFRLKTHMSLRVDKFENMTHKSELIIRRGMTSDRPVLDVLKSTNNEMKNYDAPLTVGFYVSFRGVFNTNSKLALVYTAFSRMECYIGSEFLCDNGKCIPMQLQCDGFDHCGDKSDEPDSCASEWAHQSIDRRWYLHTSNYYFPKNDHYPDLRAATMVFIGGSLGLLFLITTLIILLYKLSNRARQQRELQSQLQTISELLDSNHTRQENPLSAEEPPAYEAPPDYDDVIKVGMDEVLKRASRRPSEVPLIESTPRSGRPSIDYQHSLLEVVLPPEFSDNIGLSGTTPNEQSLHVPTTTNLILIDTEPSIVQVNRCHKFSQTNLIPDSPPPLYKEYWVPASNENCGEGTSNGNSIIAHQTDLIDIMSTSTSSDSSYVEHFPSVLLKPDVNISVSEAIVQTSWLNFPTSNIDAVSTIETHDNQLEQQVLSSNNQMSFLSSLDTPNIISIDPRATSLYRQLSIPEQLTSSNNTPGIECEHCGGAIVPRCSVDDSQITCFGQIRLFESIRGLQSSGKSLVCRCNQMPEVSLINLKESSDGMVDGIVPPLHENRRRAPMLFQRSSSVELFTFLPNRQNIYRSVGSKLDRK